MPTLCFGHGVLSDATADRIRQLAEKYRLRFVREPSKFRVEADAEAGDGRAFTAALRRDQAFYETLQQEADLFDGEDDSDIPW